MKNQRPIICWRICRSPGAGDSRAEPLDAASCWPNVFESRIPETDSDSSVIALISASDCWVRSLTTRRDLADAVGDVDEEGQHAEAEDASAASRGCSIAMTVVATVAKLASSDAAVSVTTDCTPPTSLRDPALDLAGPRLGEEAQRHPLQVRVERESQVVHDALADHVERYDCQTPSRLVTIGSTIISPALQVEQARGPAGRSGCR